jgi:hypothetical protein
MKRRRHPIELGDDQQLILGILLVILVAVSMLYCLGLGSLLLRDMWEEGLPLLNGTEMPIEELPITPTLVAPPATDAVPVVP